MEFGMIFSLFEQGDGFLESLEMLLENVSVFPVDTLCAIRPSIQIYDNMHVSIYKLYYGLYISFKLSY